MIGLFVHLLVLVLVLALLYWLVTLVAGLLPPPVGNVVRVVLSVILVLIAIAWLLGESGTYAAPWRGRW